TNWTLFFLLLPLWEKVGAGGARMRGVGARFAVLRLSRAIIGRQGAHTPHPSGSACHLLPQGEKGAGTHCLPRRQPVSVAKSNSGESPRGHSRFPAVRPEAAGDRLAHVPGLGAGSGGGGL